MGIIPAILPVDFQVIKLGDVLQEMVLENSDGGEIHVECNEFGVLWTVKLHTKSIQIIDAHSKFWGEPDAGENLCSNKATGLGDGADR